MKDLTEIIGIAKKNSTLNLDGVGHRSIFAFMSMNLNDEKKERNRLRSMDRDGLPKSKRKLKR